MHRSKVVAHRSKFSSKISSIKAHESNTLKDVLDPQKVSLEIELPRCRIPSPRKVGNRFYPRSLAVRTSVSTRAVSPVPPERYPEHMHPLDSVHRIRETGSGRKISIIHDGDIPEISHAGNEACFLAVSGNGKAGSYGAHHR